MRWERRVSHPGLNAFRVIRGGDPQEVNTKAELQLKMWEERWQKSQLARAAASDKAQKKQIAEAKTREAEEQLAAISNTLLASLTKDHSVHWDDLKDKTPFAIAAPQKPSPSALPRRPLREDVAFGADLGFLDKLIRSRRERKIAESKLGISSSF
jgi:restriction system protein